MTRAEEITMAADAASRYESPSFFEAFVTGAEWADTHPHWVSVEDELPMEHEWILGYSLKREYIDVYNFDSNGLIEAHGITHWMHLSPPPIITSSKKGD